jgi:hypothetical protein
VAETIVKRLLCCRFRRTVKAMGQVYQCWWRICREINVFYRLEYHMFYVLYPFETYLLTLPHIILPPAAMSPVSVRSTCRSFLFNLIILWKALYLYISMSLSNFPKLLATSSIFGSRLPLNNSLSSLNSYFPFLV